VCHVLLRILVQVMELPVHYMKLSLCEERSNAPMLRRCDASCFKLASLVLMTESSTLTLVKLWSTWVITSKS
jgi:hypothetical protein